MKNHLMAVFLLLGLQADAQLKQLTIEDAVLKQRSKLAPARLSQLQWLPASTKFSFVGSGAFVDVLLMGVSEHPPAKGFLSTGVHFH